MRIDSEKNIFHALVDTGATASCISSKVSELLGIQPKGRSRMNTAAGNVKCDVYRVNIHIPIPMLIKEEDNHILSIRPFKNIEVVSTSQHKDYDVIVGMDIIAAGSLNVSGETFVFCT